MKRLSLLLVAITAVFPALPAQVVTASTAPRPNVVLIMPDDISFDEFSYYHPEGPRTPNIDMLARQSVRLTDFHVSPTCSPTRAALMTGRYNDATGVWHTILGRYYLRPDEVTAAEVFRANGYRTGLFGKWHLGESYPLRPKDRGFERVVTFRGGGIDQQHSHWGNRNTMPLVLHDDDRLVPLADEDDGIPGAFATNHFTSRAIEYMKRCATAGEPFFVYLPYNVAHSPHDLPPDARPGVNAHTATVENLDKNVGRVLACLDQAGLADDTVLIFLTDNGSNTARFRAGKGSHYEGGHRVPCFIRWKNGGLAGTPASAREMPWLAAHIDLLPTLMDLLGLKDVAQRSPRVPLHGRSVKPWLAAGARGDSADFRSRTLVVDNQRMDELKKFRQTSVMRDDFGPAGNLAHKWRLVSTGASGWELYDVLADPKQAANMIANPGTAAVVAGLKTAYEVWWRDVSARAGEYVRPIIGAPQQPVTCLYSHDWHTGGNVPWNQTMIAEGMKGNGFNAVEFAAAGRFTFDLRRWPREIADQTTATSALPTPILSARNNQPTTGAALPIHSGRIRVWHDHHTYADEKKAIAPEADGIEFQVALPAGPALVQSWFYDGDGKEIAGAYYIYVTATR